MMVSFVLSFFPRDVLDEILNLIESVSEDFPSYFNNQACSLSHNIYVITRLFITNNNLFEMKRKIIFTNYVSEFKPNKIQVLKGHAEEVFSIRHYI